MSNRHEKIITELMLISLLTKSMATKLNDNQLWPDEYENQLAQVESILRGLPRSTR